MNSKASARLHYIYDPLCGWCYAASPLVWAARAIAGLTVHIHGGGMWVGDGRRSVTPQLREYVTPHNARITQLTGQPFGAAFTDGLLLKTGVLLDSEPPTAAILAAEALTHQGLDMLRSLQRAFYVDGQNLAELTPLVEAARDLGLNAAAFATEFERQMAGPVQEHISESRRLLNQVGGAGFPTFAMEVNGDLRVLDVSRYLGQPQRWQDALRGVLAQ